MDHVPISRLVPHDDDGEPVGDLTDPGPGLHMWMLITAISVTEQFAALYASGEKPSAATVAEAIDGVHLSGPGCFKCEREYEPLLAALPCTGSLLD